MEIELHGLRGVLGARFAGGDSGATGALVWSASVAAALQVAPRSARFERTSPAGSFLETVWLPDRLPGWVVELRPTGAWRPDTPLEGRLELPADRAAMSWDAAGGVVVVERSRSGGGGATTTIVVLGVDRQIGGGRGEDPPGWLLSRPPEQEDESVVVPLRLTPTAPDGRILLVVLDGGPDPVRLRSLAAVAAHRGRARVPAGAFRIESGIAEVDESIAWAWTRLRDRLRETEGGARVLPPPTDTAGLVRTALACGLDRVADAASDSERARTLEADPVASRSSIALPTLDSSAPDPRAAVLRWRTRLAEESPVFFRQSHQWLVGLLDDLLGFRADAPAGRIHLTPTLPPHWTRMAIRQLACDGTRFDLEYERITDGRQRVDRWTARPTEGAVPLTLILRVPAAHADATPVGEVRIDGEPAELDVEQLGTRRLFPVQLPLDGERVLEVVLPADPGE